MRISLIGFGNVGRDFAKLLLKREINACVVAIMASKGGVLRRDCMRASDLNRYIEEGIYGESVDVGLDDVINAGIDAAVISIPPSYDTGEPNLSMYRKLLSSGVSVVTSDKTGLALDFAGLMAAAGKGGASIEYRATVMAGTPAIDLVRGLWGREVNSIKAALNATTNFVLTKIEEGLSRTDAVELAIREKLAEPDPRTDLDGWDAGAKLVILANQLGLSATLRDVKLSRFDIDDEHIRQAIKAGKRVKQVAVADMDSGGMTVTLTEVDASSPLASISGNYNAIEIRIGGDTISLKGPAGPSARTAEVMLADLLRLKGAIH